MRLVCFVLLSLFSLGLAQASTSDNSIYIVQSKHLSDIYGDTLGSAVKQRLPDHSVEVLQLRDFDVDRFTQSKEFVAREVRRRAASYSNLVLLGQETSGFGEGTVLPILLPSLVNADENTSATPAAFLAVAEQVKEHIPTIQSVYYVLSDRSPTSQLRLREFARITDPDRTVDMVSFNVRNTTELRKALIKINHRNQTPGVIINNIFSLPDQDSLGIMRSDAVDDMILRTNTRHIELGLLKPDQRLAFGVGVGYQTVADAICSIIEGETIKSFPMEIGVNLDRVSELGFNQFVLQEGERIQHVGVNPP